MYKITVITKPAYSLISNLFFSLLFDFCEAFLIQRILFLKLAFHFQVLRRLLLLFSTTCWFWLFCQNRCILLFPGKTWQKRNSHTMSLFYLHTDSIHVRSKYCSAQNWAIKSCTTPQEISCGLNIFSKPIFRPVFPYCTLKQSPQRRQQSLYDGPISFLPFHTGLLRVITVSTKSDHFDPKMSHNTCFAVMVQYQHDTSKLCWWHFVRWA